MSLGNRSKRANAVTYPHTELAQGEIVTSGSEKPAPKWFQEMADKNAGKEETAAGDRHAKVS